MACGQKDTASGDTVHLEAMSQMPRGLLAATVVVDIEGKINGASAVA